MPTFGRPFGDLPGHGEPAESRPPQPAQQPPCCLEGGPLCPEARAGIARKLNLSPRQMEVAACVMAGQGNKEIARTLDIDRDTVHSHISAIYAKLDVHSRGELIQSLQAAQHAWLSDSPPVPEPPSWCKLKRLY